MTFQVTVVIIAIIILIIALIMTSYHLYSARDGNQYPPVSPADCPDYWLSEENLCHNTISLGTCNRYTPKDFNTSYFDGDTGTCQKKKWANICGVSWDGITNNPNICKPDS